MPIRRFLDRHLYVILMVPGLLLLVVLVLVPILYAGRISLYQYPLGELPRFIGFKNYIQLLSSTRFLLATTRTLYYTGLSLIVPIIGGIIAALIFNQSFRGKGIIRTLFFVPYMATPAAAALIWVVMYHPSLGVFNYLLGLLRLPRPQWIFSRSTVIPSLAIVESWRLTPFVMIIVLGGLSAISTEILEASKIDGASPWQTFFYVILPLIRAHVVIATILISILLLKAFAVLYVMTQGGPGRASETLNILLYLQAFSFYHLGYASAVAIIFSVIIVLLTGILLKIRRGNF